MRHRRGQAEFVPARGRGRRARRMVLGCALAAALLAGCAPIVHQQGHIRDAEVLAQIEPGQQTREEVARLLGTPSAVGTFDDRRWYYISRRTETTAFYEPELVNQERHRDRLRREGCRGGGRLDVDRRGARESSRSKRRARRAVASSASSSRSSATSAGRPRPTSRTPPPVAPPSAFGRINRRQTSR